MSIRRPTRSPLYLLLMLLVWPGVVGGYALLAHLRPPATGTSVVLWILLCGSAMMSAYHPVIHALDFFAQGTAASGNAVLTGQERVAFLYTVCDDFDPVALESCIEAAREVGGEVYVLDDSRQDPLGRCVAKYEAHLVRRRHPSAFKAGNINDAIESQNLSERYGYIVLADADEVFIPGASRRLVATLAADPELAFVQLAHSSRSETSGFARTISVMTDVKYRYYRKYTNRYGLPLSHGHGVAIRLSLLRNGLPEVISEDIAMSIELRQGGYRGLFLPDPLCREAVVQDLATFCQRERRCMAADIECLLLKAMPMIFGRRVGLVESWDLLVRQLRYPIKLLLPLTILWALLLSISAWGQQRALGLTGATEKTCWVFISLIPWASYFRFLGIRRFFSALDFMLVSLPSHVGCMIVYLEGALVGLAHMVRGRHVAARPSNGENLWIPTGARSKNAPFALGDLLRYFAPGVVVATASCVLSNWLLASIGICLIAQWAATRASLAPKVGACAVRCAGVVMVLALIMYIVSPLPDYVGDLTVLSLAVTLF